MSARGCSALRAEFICVRFRESCCGSSDVFSGPRRFRTSFLSISLSHTCFSCELLSQAFSSQCLATSYLRPVAYAVRSACAQCRTVCSYWFNGSWSGTFRWMEYLRVIRRYSSNACTGGGAAADDAGRPKIALIVGSILSGIDLSLTCQKLSPDFAGGKACACGDAVCPESSTGNNRCREIEGIVSFLSSCMQKL